MVQFGFFDLPDHMERFSETGDPLEEMARIIDFEAFRPTLDVALRYSDGCKGGRPPYDPEAMFKVLILAAQNNVSDGRMEFLIRDRLSWLRFLGLELGKPTPDENTIRLADRRLTGNRVPYTDLKCKASMAAKTKTQSKVAGEGSSLHRYMDVILGRRSWGALLYYELCVLLGACPGALGPFVRKRQHS